MRELKQATDGTSEAAPLPAPIDRGAHPEFADADLWRELSKSLSAPEFCGAWLTLQASLIEGAVRAVVVLGDPADNEFSPLAYWPTRDAASPALAAVCEAAISEKRGVFRAAKTQGANSGGEAGDVMGLPILLEERPYGVVAFEVTPRDAAEMGKVMRQLQWGSMWLESWIRRERFANRSQVDTVLDVTVASLEHPKFRAAATAVATDLSTMLGCDRVSIGFRRGAHTRVHALSHSAEFGDKNNLIRTLGLAMDEAADQHAVIAYPAQSDGVAQVTQAHEELARSFGANAVCTVPFSEGERIIGGMTLERQGEDPFAPEEIDLCRHVATLVGPILETKRRDDRWLIRKASQSLSDLLRKIFGPRHLGLKLAVIALLALGLFLSFADGDYRIKSDATLEGTVERAVTAPISGYILASHVRAGDLVEAGQLMATLDEKELRLERIRWVSQKEQRHREHSKALATGNRAEVRILGAQIAQAEAQIELIDEQLDRIRIIAPFDGVVVTGDLSQSLSAPVERGDVLFEVAPLDSYRVALRIDEREITQLEIGQSGQLALSALTGDPLDFTVTKITPISTSEEGRNYFRVEARLNTMNELLRPGMEGIGKVNIDRRKLAWIYTHKLVQSVSMRFWSWWP